METLAWLQQHFSPVAVELFWQCIRLVLLLVIFIPSERIFALRPQKTFRKAFLADMVYYFLNNPLPRLLLLFPAAIIGRMLQFLVPSALLSGISAMPLVMRFAVAMIVEEIRFYWGHRWSHAIPHENHGCDSSSGRHSQNSGVSRATLTGTARGSGLLQIFRPTGLVLKTAQEAVPDSCASACAIPI